MAYRTRRKFFVTSAVAVGLLMAARHGVLPAGATLTSASSNVSLGQQLASGYGWGSGSEWTCLDELWTRESGWRMVWNTAGSGAYGIPQSLPASKMASAGGDYMTNPATQIRWGLGYIRGTYGTPCGAWAHETAANWY
jgi:resuscitation-promoting factor RpfB